MAEHTFDKEKMDSIRALAETNMQVSSAKAELIKLQSIETTYLEEREKKAVERVTKVLNESKELVEETKNNYAEIQTLLNTASSLAGFITEVSGKLENLVKIFNENSETWDRQSKETEEQISIVRRDIKTDQIRIQNDRKGLEIREKTVRDLERLVKDRYDLLERTIKRIK